MMQICLVQTPKGIADMHGTYKAFLDSNSLGRFISMEGGRYSVDLGNLQRNRRNEIGRKKSRKGKELAGSSSQSRDDFETGYQRRDGDAMSEEQLQQELARHNNRFLQQQQILTTIDEEELEDEDAEEMEPETAEEESAGSHDADEPASSQTATGNKKK
ncbi:unnamed protein product [Cuscuta epithymum]|uniref:Uncharacterized protein n=1 Tax=Cuscuta epithymum TaxID=186058 RepID=A0AAV0F129_9ASTE|nr:unnamed protein product [Cuscuta epithymum]